MNPQILQRITTQYNELEDRIRLSGQDNQGQGIIIWLTLRLMQRLVPSLTNWLEKQYDFTPGADILLGFAQQAAKADLRAEAPVQTEAHTAEWVASVLDLAYFDQAVRLTFTDAGRHQVVMILESKPLRQWLAIVLDAYVRADWPLDAWPHWMRESTIETPVHATVQ